MTKATTQSLVRWVIDTKDWLLYAGRMRSLLESHRLVDTAFWTASAVAIDEMCSMFYAGSMGSLFGWFSTKVASAGYMRSLHNARVED